VNEWYQSHTHIAIYTNIFYDILLIYYACTNLCDDILLIYYAWYILIPLKWTSHMWVSNGIHESRVNEDVMSQYLWDISFERMSHVPGKNESWHVYKCSMSQTWMSHAAHTKMARQSYERVMSRIWMSHGTYIHGHDYTNDYINEACPTCEWVMLHTSRKHVNHTNESYHAYEWVIAWVVAFI